MKRLTFLLLLLLTLNLNAQKVSLSGQVVDRAGYPIENASVQFYQEGSLRQQMSTGENGSFTALLRAEELYEIRVKAIDFLASTQKIQMPVLGQSSPVLRITLASQPMELRGQVFDRVHNKVVPNLPLELKDILKGESSFGRTDAEGRYVLPLIPQKNYELLIDYKAIPGKMDITAEPMLFSTMGMSANKILNKNMDVYLKDLSQLKQLNTEEKPVEVIVVTKKIESPPPAKSRFTESDPDKLYMSNRQLQKEMEEVATEDATRTKNNIDKPIVQNERSNTKTAAETKEENVSRPVAELQDDRLFTKFNSVSNKQLKTPMPAKKVTRDDKEVVDNESKKTESLLKEQAEGKLEKQRRNQEDAQEITEEEKDIIIEERPILDQTKLKTKIGSRSTQKEESSEIKQFVAIEMIDEKAPSEIETQLDKLSIEPTIVEEIEPKEIIELVPDQNTLSPGMKEPMGSFAPATEPIKGDIETAQLVYRTKAEMFKWLLTDRSDTFSPVWENSIYFRTGRAYLSKEGFDYLDNIITQLNMFPNAKADIEVFSDGQLESSIEDYISKMRMNQIVDYLMERGIAFDRLILHLVGNRYAPNKCTKGINCTEEQHQENRRVKITIE